MAMRYGLFGGVVCDSGEGCGDCCTSGWCGRGGRDCGDSDVRSVVSAICGGDNGGGAK